MRTKRVARILVVAAAGLLPLGGVAATASPAEAKVVCSAGVWGGNHGWGDCTENSVPGPRRWQLVTVCSWGWVVKSGILTGRGHVDTTCPWPQSASYSYIRFY